MKTIPPRCPEPETGPKYWRSLDQLAEAPEFRRWVEREFPEGASDFNDPVSRRRLQHRDVAGQVVLPEHEVGRFARLGRHRRVHHDA